MPLESVARIAVSRHEIYFARAARVRDAHATAGENIAKILVVIVALVPHADLPDLNSAGIGTITCV